jgi:hypothetical protein
LDLRAIVQRPQHHKRVHACAGLSAVILQCHPDTWQFARRAMSANWVDPERRWHKDPADEVTEAKDGLVRVRLSGARLAELMAVLWYVPNKRRGEYSAPVGMVGTNRAPSTPAEGEQALRLYRAIAAVVDQARINSPRQGEFPTVIIDDATVS